MDKMTFFAVVFQSIPESIIILCLGLASIGIKPDFRKVLPAAILSSMISWLVRGLPIPFGLHSLIGLVTIISLSGIKEAWGYSVYRVILAFPERNILL